MALDALDEHLHFVRDFLGGGFMTNSWSNCFCAHQLADDFDHVHRHADGARLIGDGAGDRLADLGGVGGEFVTAAVFELLDALHQAHVALLDDVEEGKAAVGVFLADGNDEPQVGLGHFRLGLVGLGGVVASTDS